MILAANNLTKAYNGKTVIDDASFHIEEREKAAIVGINGAGKTTLLQMLIGNLPADRGTVTLSKGATMGYLAQHQDLYLSGTIYEALMEVKADIVQLERRLRQMEKDMKHTKGEPLEALMHSYALANEEFESKNGYAFRSELTGVLKGLGFLEEEFHTSVDILSGGQKTRVSLGKLLLSKPDIILLDEPTNHLDLNSITWLETFLVNYPGSVLIISHDRYFLDRVVTRIIDVENTKVSVYSGNYSSFTKKKEGLKEAALKLYEKQQADIKHQKEVIAKLKSFNREKSIKRAESREKMLAKIEPVDKPAEIKDTMKLHLEPSVISGEDVLTIQGLAKAFDETVLFTDMELDIKRGEKVAVIGDNGTGKTTLFKIINGVTAPDAGSVRTGVNVHIGYFDQEHHVLHMEKTLFDELQDTYPTMDNTRIRNMLAAFLFTGDDVFKRVGDLSGGERGRLSLAKLMLSKSNFLILDEPTNHLDMVSKGVLENALNLYTGTVLYVSHDRYFINQTATRILELTNQRFVNYIGNYDYYLEKKELLTTIYAPAAAAGDSVEDGSSSKLDWQAKKEAQAAERKRLNDLKKAEEGIEELESRDKEIDALMADESIARDVNRLMKLSEEKEELLIRLEELYERWNDLSE